MDKLQTTATIGLLNSLNSQEELPKNLQTMVNNNKILSLVFSGEMSISNYRSPEQKKFVANLIKAHLATMTSLLNIGKNISAEQAHIICEHIVSEKEFSMLSPSEFREAFSRGVKGNYGKNYDSVDIQRIYDWVRGYIEDRFIAIENFREVEHSQRKQDAKKPLNALAKLNLPPIPTNTGEREKQPHRERTAAELELDKYIREFEDLFIEQKKDNTAIKFVDYKGQEYDLSDYCNRRWEEARGK